MTKKHFKAIAEIMRCSTSVEDAVNKLAIYFSLENKRFDSEKFKCACKSSKGSLPL